MDDSVIVREFKKNLENHAAYIDANLNCSDQFLEYFATLFPKYHKLKTLQDKLKRKRTFIKYYTAAIEDERTKKMAMYRLLLALVETGQNGIEKLLSGSPSERKIYNWGIPHDKCEGVKPYTPEALTAYSCRTAYRMTGDKRGYCLIINMKKFEPGGSEVEDNKERLGSEKDVTELENVFKQLHFHVTIGVDLECREIEEKMHQALSHTAEKNYGMFVMIIMSHGARGGILIDKYKEKFTWDVICRIINNFHALKGKPKVLVVQACSGYHTSTITNVENDHIGQLGSSKAWREPIDDTLIIKSSFEGYSSVRYTDQGSPFITALVKILKNFAGQYHLEEICKMVQNEIREVNKRAAEWIELKKPEAPGCYIPVPCYLSFLSKMIYLLPGLQDNQVLAKEADESKESPTDSLESKIMELALCDAKLRYPINSEDVYNMTDKYRGRCLIIHVEEVKDGKKRLGSECDAKDLKCVFEKLDFYVQLKENPKGKEIEKELSKELHEQQYGMFVLIILSPGMTGGYILGYDGIRVDQHKLHLKVYSCENLKNKPKFFITDAAAGTFEKIVNETWTLLDAFPKPAIEDVLILSSCLDDTLPDVHLKHQNQFIKALIEILMGHSNELHLEEICKKVQDRIRKFLREVENNTVQIPCYAYFLRKKLYLFPGLKTEAYEQVVDDDEEDYSTVKTEKGQVVDEDEVGYSSVETEAKLEEIDYERNGMNGVGIEGELRGSVNIGQYGSESQQVAESAK